MHVRKTGRLIYLFLGKMSKLDGDFGKSSAGDIYTFFELSNKYIDTYHQ